MVLAPPFASAFSSSSLAGPMGLSRKLSSVPTAPLRMSDLDDDDDLDDLFGDDNDALSALIGKRDQIYTSKPTASVTKPKTPTTDEEIDARLEEISAKVENFDYEDLPEFTSKRPLRQPKKKDKKEEKDDSAPDRDEISFIDYQADFDDENELHISNRIGFGTAGWGDIKKGFKEGKKLKKKEIKAGRYLAGDLQVNI